MSLKKAHELTRELTHAPANTCRPQHAHVRPHHGTSNARPGEPLAELGGANLERVREDDGRLRPVRRCLWEAQRLVGKFSGIAQQRAVLAGRRARRPQVDSELFVPSGYNETPSHDTGHGTGAHWH